MRGGNSYWRKAVDWLNEQPAGTRVTTHQIAAALGFEGDESHLRHSLRTGVGRGWLKREFVQVLGQQGGNKLAMWFLAEEPPKPKAKAVEYWEDDRELLPRRTHAPEIQPRPGMLFPGVYVGAL